MHKRELTTLFAALLIIGLAAQPTLCYSGRSSSWQDSQKHLGIIQYPLTGKCVPVKVTSLLMGGPSRNVVLAAVALKNVSDKTITAISLTWYVLPSEEGSRIARGACDAVSEAARPTLSGKTGRIDVATLAAEESCSIAMNENAAQMAAVSRPVLIDAPIIALKDISSLTADGTLRTLKEDYVILIGVSEVEYADGTRWESGGIPWQSHNTNSRNSTQ